MATARQQLDAVRTPCPVCGTGQIVVLVSVMLELPRRFGRRLTKRVLQRADVKIHSATWGDAVECCSTPGCRGPRWLVRSLRKGY